MGQALAFAARPLLLVASRTGVSGRPRAKAGGMPCPRGWHGSGLWCQKGEWRRREEGSEPGARVWQLPPEKTWGCPRVSRLLVTCQGCADWKTGAQAGERPGDLGNLGAGQESRPGPFAEACIDPQGSLLRSQPRPPVLGARLYHGATPAGGEAATAAPGGGLQRRQCAADRRPSLDTDATPGGSEAGGANGWGAAQLQSLPRTPPHPVVGAGTQTKAGGE